jgi:HK97 family phage portal protein
MGKWENAKNFFRGGKAKQVENKFNESFFWGSNGYTENDDNDLKRYIDLAYNINPDVFSVINQIANKLVSIPYYIKEVKDTASNVKLKSFMKSTNYDPSFTQRIKANKLEMKALSEDEYSMPFDKPNPSQDWLEFFKLSETFLKTTGNVYWYKLMPDEGMNAGEPIQLYCLPSHLMEIVLKDNANMLSVDTPISHYILTDYKTFTKFKESEVVHISVDNPNFGMSGEHLYGQSPLRAAWKNIEASNKGLDLNINTLKNGGVFGFIHSKGTALTSDQGKELKERLKEMNKSPEDLSRIAGISSEIGFTKLSLTADELKPFDYLKYNQKQICNVLGWSDTLLNNDDGGKYDKQVTELKRVLINTVVPDAKLLENAFNYQVLALIKAYKGKCLVFDYKELPEMQDDLETMTKWVTSVVDNGIMNRTEARYAMRLPEVTDSNLDIFTVKDDIMSLEDAILPTDDLKL